MSDATTDQPAVTEDTVTQAPPKKKGVPTGIVIGILAVAVGAAAAGEMYALREPPPIILHKANAGAGGRGMSHPGAGAGSKTGAKGGAKTAEPPKVSQPNTPPHGVGAGSGKSSAKPPSTDQ